MSHPQPQLDTTTRERCPHCGKLLWTHTRKCWACGKTPEEWGMMMQQQHSGTGVEMVPVNPDEEITGDGTGEALEEMTPWCSHYQEPAEPGAVCMADGDEPRSCGPECDYYLSDKPEEAHTYEPPETKLKPDYRVIDNNTGELVQLSLLGAQWEEYKVATIRLSLSGGDEYVKTMFDQLVDGELSPGALVRVTAAGVVKEHAPIYKKGSHEGKTVILLEVLNKIEVIGHMTGKVEAAQNVDGEAKVLEEDVDPEVALQEADDRREQGEE